MKHNEQTQFDMVKKFHEIYGCNINEIPKLPNKSERELRKKLLKEEYEEYLDGEENNNIVEISDALADMLYIIYGTAVSYGIPINKIFQEVHESNLSKCDENGNPIIREDGKILKGKNYFTPKIEKILKDHNCE